MPITELERVSGERMIQYGNMRILVHAQPARKMLQFTNALSLLKNAVGGNVAGLTSAVVVAVVQDLCRVMDESVSVDGNSEVKALDCPTIVFPQIVRAFIELNFDLGEWRALGEVFGIGDLVGDLVGSLKSEMMSQAASGS